MPRVNSHATLMRWRRDDLVDLVNDNARKLRVVPPDVSGLDKRGLAHLVIKQATRLSAREGMQGE